MRRLCPVQAADNQLGASAREALTIAVRDSKPLLITGGIPVADVLAIRSAWDGFVGGDDEAYCTNQGPSSDSPEGSSNHGYCTLAEVWGNAWRIETELDTSQRPKKRPRNAFGNNPVVKFLRDARHAAATTGVSRLQQELHDFAVAAAGPQCVVVQPSFITGSIRKGIEDGGVPCGTHQDAYQNILLVLTGRKVFYIAEPATFADETVWRKGGKPNERFNARPLDSTAADSPCDWFRVEVGPGDILYLPENWWHAVLSDPHTVMTNVWTQSTARLPTEGATHSERVERRAKQRAAWLEAEQVRRGARTATRATRQDRRDYNDH